MSERITDYQNDLDFSEKDLMSPTKMGPLTEELKNLFAKSDELKKGFAEI